MTLNFWFSHFQLSSTRITGIPPQQAYAVLRMEPKALCMLDKWSTNWSESQPTSGSLFGSFSFLSETEPYRGQAGLRLTMNFWLSCLYLQRVGMTGKHLLTLLASVLCCTGHQSFKRLCQLNWLLRNQNWERDGQIGKGATSKPNNLSSSFRIHMVEERSDPDPCKLSSWLPFTK